MTMPRLRSAKSMRAISDTWSASIVPHSQGRTRRRSASGAYAISRSSTAQVPAASAGAGSPWNSSRMGPGRASGLSRIRARALPSSQDGLVSFVTPLYV